MFIKVKDIQFNEEIIINTDNISFINEKAQTLSLNGVHGQGNGLLRIDAKDIRKVIKSIQVIS